MGFYMGNNIQLNR